MRWTRFDNLYWLGAIFLTLSIVSFTVYCESSHRLSDNEKYIFRQAQVKVLVANQERDDYMRRLLTQIQADPNYIKYRSNADMASAEFDKLIKSYEAKCKDCKLDQEKLILVEEKPKKQEPPKK